MLYEITYTLHNYSKHKTLFIRSLRHIKDHFFISLIKEKKLLMIIRRRRIERQLRATSGSPDLHKKWMVPRVTQKYTYLGLTVGQEVSMLALSTCSHEFKSRGLLWIFAETICWSSFYFLSFLLAKCKVPGSTTCWQSRIKEGGGSKGARVQDPH